MMPLSLLDYMKFAKKKNKIIFSLIIWFTKTYTILIMKY